MKRNKLKFVTKSGESESVPENIVTEWKSELKEKYSPYKPEDIFNIDEIGIFWRLIQNKTYSLPEEFAKGYTKSRDRMTAQLILNFTKSQKLFILDKNILYSDFLV